MKQRYIQLVFVALFLLWAIPGVFAQGGDPVLVVDPDNALSWFDYTLSVVDTLAPWVLAIVFVVGFVVVSIRNNKTLHDIVKEMPAQLKLYRDTESFRRAEKEYGNLPEMVQDTVETVGDAINLVGNLEFLPEDIRQLLQETHKTLEDLENGPETDGQPLSAKLRQ